MAAIGAFLIGLAREAGSRGYHFDGSKILKAGFRVRIAETRGQLLYEWGHLKSKLRVRAPMAARRLRGVREPRPHPLFRIGPGAVRAWEKRQPPSGPKSH
jgi:hypothetical protein